MRGQPAALYRLFDAYDQLLYIGRSRHPETRIGAHRKAIGGWQLVIERWTVEWFPTDTAAYRAQQRAVVAEGPLHPDVTCDVKPLEVSVYRIFDESGQLMYIGQSKDPFHRVEDHRGRFPIHRWTAEVFPDRLAACEAERSAIANEHPVHNLVAGGAPGGRRSTYEARYDVQVETRQRYQAGEITIRAAVAELERIGLSTWKAFDKLGLETNWPRPYYRLDRLLALNGLS